MQMAPIGCGTRESNSVSPGYEPDMVYSCPCHSTAMSILYYTTFYRSCQELVEHVMRIELTFRPWQGCVLTIIRHMRVLFFSVQ